MAAGTPSASRARWPHPIRVRRCARRPASGNSRRPQNSQQTRRPAADADAARGRSADRRARPRRHSRSRVPCGGSRASSSCPIASRILLTTFARLASETNTPGQMRSISSVFDNTRGRFSTSNLSSSNAFGGRCASGRRERAASRRCRGCSRQSESSRRHQGQGVAQILAGPWQNSGKGDETVKTSRRRRSILRSDASQIGPRRGGTVECQSRTRRKRGLCAQLKRIVFVAAGSVIAALTFVSPASASSDTHVVHPGQSIQAAVDAASPGDTVVVKAGTYRESVTIHTNGLTLRAQGSVTLKPPLSWLRRMLPARSHGRDLRRARRLQRGHRELYPAGPRCHHHRFPHRRLRRGRRVRLRHRELEGVRRRGDQQ